MAAGEFAEGFVSRSDLRYLSVIESCEILPVTKSTVDVYARIVRHLRGKGLLIGANDLWIASVTLEHEMPLVTRNHQHFSRIPDLQVMGY